MSDNEAVHRSHPPRKNVRQNRPPPMNPGVRKAVNNFGVTDLRQLLNKKHQEQDDNGSKESENRPRGANPPPDPGYNFLKDASRDEVKHYQPKRNETSGKHHNKEADGVTRRTKEKNENDLLHKNQSPRKKENADREKKELRFSDTPNIVAEGQKKELRFSDTTNIVLTSQNAQSSRNNYKSRENAKRKDEKIENPVNIKVELSTTTGQRSCTLDENTKIPDIKHVPDQIEQRPFRGYYHGKGTNSGEPNRDTVNKNRESETSSEDTHSKQNEVSQTENEGKKSGPEPSIDGVNIESSEHNPDLDDYEDEDYNVNYSSEYDNSFEQKNGADDDNNDLNNSVTIDANLKDSITITSSQFQDGDIKRSVTVETDEKN